MTEIISYSELSSWDTCKRQWYYRFQLGFRPVEAAEAMSTGTKGHKLLQSFYTAIREGLSLEEAHVKTVNKAKQLMSEEQPGDFGLLKAWVLVDNYIKEFKSSSEIVLVENRFLFPASTFSDDPELVGIHIGFTPDLVVKRKGGFYDVEDSKFVQRSWGQKKLNRFQQAKLYQIFLQEMGYNVTRSAIRFFNLETAKITERPYILKAGERETIIRDFLAGTKEVVKFRQLSNDEKALARRTSNYMTCQFCSFEYPCNLEAEGKDASKTFNALYMKSDYDYSS